MLWIQYVVWFGVMSIAGTCCVNLALCFPAFSQLRMWRIGGWVEGQVLPVCCSPLTSSSLLPLHEMWSDNTLIIYLPFDLLLHLICFGVWFLVIGNLDDFIKKVFLFFLCIFSLSLRENMPLLLFSPSLPLHSLSCSLHGIQLIMIQNWTLTGTLECPSEATSWGMFAWKQIGIGLARL